MVITDILSQKGGNRLLNTSCNRRSFNNQLSLDIDEYKSPPVDETSSASFRSRLYSHQTTVSYKTSNSAASAPSSAKICSKTSRKNLKRL